MPAVLVPAVATALLLIQSLATANPYRRDGLYGPISYLGINIAEYAMGALIALLTGLSLATVGATELLYQAANNPDTPQASHWRRRAGQLITGTAGIGVLAAGIYGLLGATVYPIQNSPFVRTALWAVLPTAIIAALVGYAAPRLPALRAVGWAHQLQQPLLPIMLATAGMMAITTGEYTTANIAVPLLSRLPLAAMATHVGGAILGVAIALTLFTQAWKRLAAGALLGLGGLVATNLSTTPTLGYAYITAVTLWWLTQAVTIAADATPTAMARLRRWWQHNTNS
jgi:hypothetical protein